MTTKEPTCLVCFKPLGNLFYCTYNVCEKCCTEDRCPIRYRCAWWIKHKGGDKT